MANNREQKGNKSVAFLDTAIKGTRTQIVEEQPKIFEEVLASGKEVKIDVSLIKPHKLNPRTVIVDEELQELAESMVTDGQIRPLIVMKDKAAKNSYILLAGERRWTANNKFNRWKEMTCVITECKNEYAELSLLFADNIQKELEYIGKAATAKALLESDGWDIESIGGLPMIGSTQSARDLLLFSQFPKRVRDAAAKSERFGTGIAKHVSQILKHGKAAEPKVIKMLKRGALMVEYEALLTRLNSSGETTARKNAVQPLFSVGEASYGTLRNTHSGMKLEFECSEELVSAASLLLKEFLTEKEAELAKWGEIRAAKRKRKK